MALLEVEGIHVFYDQIEALKAMSLAVDEKRIVTLIGGNGAGKSTTLRAISGLLHPRHGEICFAGRKLTGFGPHEIAAQGLVQVPEGRRIFGRLTVEENLAMGAFTRRGRAEIAADKEEMMVLFPRLRERLKQVAGTLSGGEQQMLAAARALMARPRLLLMDEPSMGLAPSWLSKCSRRSSGSTRRGSRFFSLNRTRRWRSASPILVMCWRADISC
jgi:branched-chain amino acid transport system ATP-binding protein